MNSPADLPGVGASVAQMLRAHTELLPPSPVPSPLQWENADVVRARLSAGASRVRTTLRTITMARALSPAAVVELFRAYYGAGGRLQQAERIVGSAKAPRGPTDLFPLLSAASRSGSWPPPCPRPRVRPI